MPLVAAFDDLKPNQSKRRTGPDLPAGTTTTFFRAAADAARAPTAIHAQYDPGSVSSAHFHTVDQFQIIIDGKGTFGRHPVTPYHVHFSRAYTPYGPLHADNETGWVFLTLRTRPDPGAQRLPAAQDKLKQIPGRRPWQITSKVSFPAQGPEARFQELPDIKDDQGLSACSLTLAPNLATEAPDPSRGDGQYVVVLTGSLLYRSKEHQALTLVFVEPEESAVTIQAGPHGLEALILNFPKVAPPGSAGSTASAAGSLSKWQCVLCAFAYDEARGMPEDGVAPGTAWEDVPETWTCPDCGAGKADFEMIEI